jgi:hypothetical protein
MAGIYNGAARPGSVAAWRSGRSFRRPYLCYLLVLMRAREPSPTWIRTDPASDLLNSLEHCLLTLSLARSDLRCWKWCVGAAYSAAQIAMVIVLDAQGQYKHLKPDARRKLLRFFNDFDSAEPAPYPERELNSFAYLVKNVAPSLPGGGVTHELEDGLNDLISLRDAWTHFGESSESVHIAVAVRAVSAAVSLIDMLPLPPLNNVYSDQLREARHAAVLTAIRALLGSARQEATRATAETPTRP